MIQSISGLEQASAVVCSTSLELGIDIGSVDLVVLMSTPKGAGKSFWRARSSRVLVEVSAETNFERQDERDDRNIPLCRPPLRSQMLLALQSAAAEGDAR